MKRRRAPGSKPINRQQKENIEFIIESLSHGWLAEERETSILFDYSEKVVYLETSYPPTARRWFENLWGDPDVKWDTKANTLKITVPWEYARSADLILKKKYREYKDG